MASEAIPPEKSPNTIEHYENVEQEVHLDRVPTVEVDTYQGLTLTCVIVYLVRRQARNHVPSTDTKQAILAVGFAEMMVIISSGSVRRPNKIPHFILADLHLHSLPGSWSPTLVAPTRYNGFRNLFLSSTLPWALLLPKPPIIGKSMLPVHSISQALHETTGCLRHFVLALPVLNHDADCVIKRGRKWFLVISCAFAVVGSIIVSRATNIDMALAGNALASISTSAQPLLFAVASEILPRRWRPAAQGGVTGIFAVAAIIGLLMGSALTKSNPSGWRIVWYFNTGCFAFTTLILLFLYNPPPRAEQINFTLREKLKKLDWVGIIMLPVAVTILCIGLTWSQNPFSWKNAHVLAPFVVGFVLVICLALYEGFIKKDGLFHHGLFKNDRNFAISCFLIFTEGMAFFVANSYVPLEVSVVFETDSVLVSLNFAIVFIGAIVGSIIASIYCSWSRQLRWPLVISYVGFVLFYGKRTHRLVFRLF